MTVFDRRVAPETYALVRYGLGFPGLGSPTESAAMLARLADPDRMAALRPVISFETVREAGNSLREAQKAQRRGEPGAEAEAKKWRQWGREAYTKNFLTDLIRCVEADDPFRERLHRFWSNHFSTRARTLHLYAGAGGYAEAAIRPHLTGQFAEMLKAAVTHPFMLVYLDQVASVGPNSPAGLAQERGLNENLAREVLELHTLGVGAPYSQNDVRQFAELLTGLSFKLPKGGSFRPRLAEPGVEMVLGVEYGGDSATLADIHLALEDLARHPATAAHLCDKLAAHFVADRPDPALVAQMIEVWLGSDGNLWQVYAAMLDHPSAWSGFGAKIKPPFDFMSSSLRAMGVSAETLTKIQPKTVRQLLLGSLRLMGQDYQKPAGPDGWPDKVEDWVHPQGLALRIGWAMRAARRFTDPSPDPREFVRSALGDAASDKLIWAASAAESRVEGIGLILASAEFNRR